MLTKQGVSVGPTQPPEVPFEHADVSRDTAAATETVDVVDGYAGPARIATYTVLFQGDTASRAAAICDLPDGRRTIAASEDAALALAMTEEEFCGRSVRIASRGFVMA